jgi:serine protease Do
MSSLFRQGLRYMAVATIMFVAGMLVVSAGGSWLGSSPRFTAETIAKPYSHESIVAADPLSFEEAFLNVAEVVNPSVVQISSSRRVKQSSVDPFGGNPLFEEFFGQRREGDEDGRDRFQLQRGLGSGAIVSSDGYIVTNRHVVNEADELDVRLFDGRQFKAEVVGSDKLSDIAVIKIDVDEVFPFIDSGTNEDVRVGQWVLAFGSPLSTNLSNTVTAGIVSALGRFSQGARIENFIQTDAAINPGNSGGPLVNLKGELVGINTAIYTQTGGYQGIGLAIPVRTVDNVVEQLINEGRVRRGYLGIRFSPISESLARALEVPRGAAQIAEVEEDGAAERAGLEKGDVIVSIDGKELTNSNELLSIVATSNPGDGLEIEYFRDDSREIVMVALGERPAELATNDEVDVKRGSEDEMESIKNELGLEIETLDDDIIARRGLDLDLRGAILSHVDQTSEAYKDADIRPGDVIVEADRQTVTNASDFLAIYAAVEVGDTFLVRLNRGGSTFLTALTKPE